MQQFEYPNWRGMTTESNHRPLHNLEDKQQLINSSKNEQIYMLCTCIGPYIEINIVYGQTQLAQKQKSMRQQHKQAS